MNFKAIFALLFIVSFSVNGKTLYKTGFEVDNEPFGAVTKANTGFEIPPKAAISGKISYSGKQSFTPGPGNSKYGKFCSKTFSPVLKNKELWTQYYFYVKDIDYPRYKSFFILKGPVKESNGIASAVYILFYNQKVIASSKSFKFKMIAGWNKVKVRVDQQKQCYDLYINDDLISKGIPFASAKSKAEINGISKVVLGGGASKEILTYIDDFYIGTDDPALKNIISVGTKSQNNNPVKAFVNINKCAVPPVIDGKNSDKCWQESSPLSPFLTVTGKMAKFQPTVARITRDDKNLYISFECFDSQLDPVLNQLSEIKANAKGRDSSVFKDDSVEVFIATDPDKPSEYHHFAVNTKGVIYDAKLPSPGAAWNAKISTGVALNDKSWIIELKIPFKELGVDVPKNGDTWNINLCRNKPSGSETSCWNPTYSSFHSYNNWGKIHFSNNRLVVDNKLPQVLAEGSNYSQFRFKNSLPQPYIVETKVNYQNADSVVTAQEFTPDSKNVLVDNEFITSTKNSTRNHCRNCTVSYSIRDAKSDELLYSTPTIEYAFTQYSPFRTSFIAENSRIFFMRFKDMYIARKSALHRMLLIQYANDLAGKFKNCELVVDLPEYIKIINPEGTGRKIKPVSVKETVVSGKDGKRRKYIFTFPAKLTYSQNKIGKANPYNNKINFVFYCDADTASKATDYVRYYTRTKVDGKVVREPDNKIPVKILPELNGKMPKKILLISSFGGYNTSMPMLSEEEYKICMENIADSGFNVFSHCDIKGLTFDDKMLDSLRALGLKIERAFFAKYKSWINDVFPESVSYLKKYPQHRAVDGNGKSINEVVSTSHLIDPKAEFRKVMERRLSAIAKKSDIVLWDHEARQIGPSAIGFDEKSRKEFSKRLNLNCTLTVKQVQNEYKKQWIDFQCSRNANLGKIMRDIVKKANPQCLFNGYSGYQSEQHKMFYGVDWHKFGKFIDYAECGYKRPLTEIEATAKAVEPKKLITGELIMCWVGNLEYDFSKLKLNLFRRLTDGNGGFLVFYDLQVDGRFWYTMAEVSRLVADYEDYFIKGNKNNNSIEIVHGIEADDVVVYEKSTGEKLVVLFNSTAKSKVCKVKFIKKPESAIIKDYYAGKTLNKTNSLTAKIKPLDVKVFILQSKK